MSLEKIEGIMRRNLDNRNMGGVYLKGELECICNELMKSKVIMIVTGFVIKDVLVGETDGPLGAVALANALLKLEKKVIIVTDKYSVDIVKKCCLEVEIRNRIDIEIIKETDIEANSLALLKQYQPSHIVAVERPGRAKDRCCYSMNGDDITHLVPNTDILFKYAKAMKIVTIAIGDGGNEIGMGKISNYIREHVAYGNLICSEFSSDYLIVAGVSNWGAHAIIAGLSIMCNKRLLHDIDTEKRLLYSMAECGAVDGVTKLKTPTVDGLSLEENISIIHELHFALECTNQFTKK
ncbi:DUF4392 domain-containing protein [Clostridiaceae bacterium M8S5]|nr:DUF4392 domain-containing protein [Clostridiaceae bacterium M8S5]